MQTYTPNQSQVQREKLLLRYVRALDEGDMDTVGAVLTAALDDPELDRLLTEIDHSLAEEEGLSPLASDAQWVRDLARQHFQSAFAEDAVERPLTVGDVAARLQADSRVPTADQTANRRLLESAALVPNWLSAQRVRDLAVELGVTASDRFWRLFRDAAIALGMGRSQSQAYMAAAREEQRRAEAESAARRSTRRQEGEEEE